MKRNRPLVASIFAAVHDECQSIVWSGVAEYAHSNNIDLITFVATSQNRVSTFEEHYHIVRDLVSFLKPDGLLIYTGALSDHFDAEALDAYCRSLGNCPMVCISQKVDGLQTVLIDNSEGIRKTVHHLLTVHNCRTFAFVKGVEHHMESEARFRAFQTELWNNGMEVDPSMVFKGHFVKASGEEAARRIIECGRIPDAVVAVNDSTALGIIAEFHRSGIHVPADVKVAGFDDVPEACDSVPALTTVRQPLAEMGRIALESLITQTRGSTNRDDIFVSTHFIPRNSCGCTPSMWGTGHSEAPPSPVPSLSNEELTPFCAAILSNNDATVSKETAINWIRSLVTAIPLDLSSSESSHCFITLLNNILVQHISAGGDPSLWQEILTILVRHKHLFLESDLQAPATEDLFQRARICISDLTLRKTLSGELQKEELRAVIRSIMLNLITSFDLDRLKGIIRRDLLSIGISACHMVLYGTAGVQGIDATTGRQPLRSRLMLSFDQNGDLLYGGAPVEFGTDGLLPESIWLESWRRDFLLFPLVFEKLCFGYILFQNNPALPKYVYEELRVHIGSALRGHSLLNELRDMSLRDELTGLYNRRGFTHLCNHMLRQVRRNRSRITIMYGDLNKLKHINDTYGHAEGDYAIATAAALLRKCVREQDVLARIGGDEFTMMATDMDESACTAVLARIDAAFSSFNAQQAKPYRVSISIGYTHQTVDDNTNVDDMLAKADEMLVDIKRSRNRETIHP